MKAITIYESTDGLRFSSELECINHEKCIQPARDERFLQELFVALRPVIVYDTSGRTSKIELGVIDTNIKHNEKFSDFAIALCRQIVPLADLYNELVLEKQRRLAALNHSK